MIVGVDAGFVAIAPLDADRVVADGPHSQHLQRSFAHPLNTIDNVDQIYFVNSDGVALAGSMEHAADMLLHGKRES
jgi:hypothetical protein